MRIKNGGTVALAGLTEDRRRLGEKKVPGLSRLPIIGGLFSSTEKRGSSREVAIFVTARLVPEAEPIVEPTKPPADQAPIELPAEKRFEKLLEESLSRPSKRPQ